MRSPMRDIVTMCGVIQLEQIDAGIAITQHTALAAVTEAARLVLLQYVDEAESIAPRRGSL